MADGFVEAWDESDFESDLEDLEFDEARRRRRRGTRRRPPAIRPTGRAWQPPRPPTGASAAATLRREAAAGRARDTQLARAVNTTREDVGDIESQVRKANSDLARLRQISMISLILPRSLDVQRQRLTIVADNEGNPVIGTTDNANAPGVNVVTGASSRLDILPVLLFMMMGRGIGTPGRAGSSTGLGSDNMLPIVLIALLPQLQQQSSGGSSTTGGLDTTTLALILMMTMGGM
jgi:hypothetical protein